MFDGKSIRVNLHFILKFGCIERFEDLGSHEAISNITKQALVSMLSGL
jgi:hypothetical protein